MLPAAESDLNAAINPVHAASMAGNRHRGRTCPRGDLPITALIRNDFPGSVRKMN